MCCSRRSQPHWPMAAIVMVFSDPGLLSRRVEGNTVPYVQTPNSEVRLLPSVDWVGTRHRFCCGVLDDKPLSGLEQQPP